MKLEEAGNKTTRDKVTKNFSHLSLVWWRWSEKEGKEIRFYYFLRTPSFRVIELKRVAACMNTRGSNRAEAPGGRLRVQCKGLDDVINVISVIRFCHEWVKEARKQALVSEFWAIWWKLLHEMEFLFFSPHKCEKWRFPIERCHPAIAEAQRSASLRQQSKQVCSSFVLGPFNSVIRCETAIWVNEPIYVTIKTRLLDLSDYSTD